LAIELHDRKRTAIAAVAVLCLACGVEQRAAREREAKEAQSPTIRIAWCDGTPYGNAYPTPIDN